MKIEELSIGNWVLFKGAPFQVENIMNNKLHLKRMSEYGFYIYFFIENNEGIEPFDISNMALDKNGFRQIDGIWRLYLDIDEKFYIDVDIDERTIFISKNNRTLCYLESDDELCLHQLQNILTINNINKHFYV